MVEWDSLTPEAQKAARYLLDNPLDVGVSQRGKLQRRRRSSPTRSFAWRAKLALMGTKIFTPLSPRDPQGAR